MKIHNENFEEIREAKKEHYTELSEKNQNKLKSQRKHTRNMMDVIPFGQPIIVGHHSEKNHRNHLKKIDNSWRKEFELNDKVEYYENKINSIETNIAIRQDDPKAVQKLKVKLESIEKQIEQVKEHNKECRKFVHLFVSQLREGYKTIWNDNGSGTYAKIIDGVLEWQMKRVPKDVKEKIEKYFKTGKLEQDPIPEDKKIFDSYVLENLNSNKNRIKKRIAQIKTLESLDDVDEEINKIRIYTEDGRVRVDFGYKPRAEIRIILKRSGFRWSPYNQVWQAYIHQHTIDKAKEIAKMETFN